MKRKGARAKPRRRKTPKMPPGVEDCAVMARPRDEWKGFGRRLELLLKEYGRSRSWLAGRIGISHQSINRWFEGGSYPSCRSLANIACTFGVSVDWLVTGRGGRPPAGGPAGEEGDDGDYVRIPECELDPEGFPWDGEDGGRPAFIEAAGGEDAIYRRGHFELRRVDPAKCRRVLARGDSMEPLIRSGDRVLVAEMEPGEGIREGGLYCVDRGCGPEVRELRRAGDGRLVLHCLNPRCRDEAFAPEDEGCLVRVCGRVLERSGWI